MSGPPDDEDTVPPVRSGMALFFRLAALYFVTAIAGYLAHLAHVPLAWMIGPILATCALNMVRLAPRVPTRTRPFGQIVVATGVGISFTPAALQMIQSHAVLMAGMAVYTVLIAAATAWVMRALTGTDRVTAFLACMPNGPVEMTNLAAQYGANTGLVSASQTLRMVAVVLFVPVGVFLLHGGLPEPFTETRPPLDLQAILTLVLTFAGAAVAALVFMRLRLSNPFFLGPLTLTAMATALSFPMVQWPAPVLAVAQIVLGTWLGSTLGPELFRNVGRKLSVSILTTVLLLMGCGGGALLIATVSALDAETLILGSAPGGVTEMTLTAKVLSLDVAMITAFHVARIILVMPNIPWMIRLLHNRAAKDNKRS
ncbi:AbrB family transcriptional regulator [Mesorhizobium sp. CAU 1741]|uniref:AbrB family transcriptional regulator n=1 Tax=Mesorhizobium sp. CAU 1741 TaxID=3140366 RepID=UPI00325B9A07